MAKFTGFQGDSDRYVRLRSTFFTDLVPLINDLAELKLLLYCTWALSQKDGDYRYLRDRDFDSETLRAELEQAAPEASAADTMKQALRLAITDGVLLAVEVALETGAETLYFMNSPDGRDGVSAIQAGQWQPGDLHNPVEIIPERPNIYQLYEANIGSITPMIAEELKASEVDFPAHWLEEAIKTAVENNKRSWRYVRAILERWDREGRNRGLTEQSDEPAWKKYVTGKYAAFIDNRPED